ncbi:MAG: peptidoglycan-binding domain-containing protein [Candidatus Omnitrophica bacterium]|nr:peptidoglycan-binding domain-containing protein [Candidatus Omnitrophota bacterium]
MTKRNLALIILVVFAVAIVSSGCDTVPKKYKQEVQGIKTRVDTLETRVDSVEAKQAEASARATGAELAAEDTYAMSGSNIEIKPRPGKDKESVKQIQLCLKNAGFYGGTIDGIKGKKTRKAIREFQKANGLAPDGVVGKKTWAALSKYSEGSMSGEMMK